MRYRTGQRPPAPQHAENTPNTIRLLIYNTISNKMYLPLPSLASAESPFRHPRSHSITAEGAKMQMIDYCTESDH